VAHFPKGILATVDRTRYPNEPPVSRLRFASGSFVGISKEWAQVLQPLVDPPQVVARNFFAEGMQVSVLGIV
jgi:hypothetical protein